MIIWLLFAKYNKAIDWNTIGTFIWFRIAKNHIKRINDYVSEAYKICLLSFRNSKGLFSLARNDQTKACNRITALSSNRKSTVKVFSSTLESPQPQTFAPKGSLLIRNGMFLFLFFSSSSVVKEFIPVNFLHLHLQ